MCIVDRFLKKDHDRYTGNFDAFHPGKMLKPYYLLVASLRRHNHTNDNPAVYIHIFPEYYFRHGFVEELRLPLPEEFINLIRQTSINTLEHEAAVIAVHAGRGVNLSRILMRLYGKIEIEDTTHDSDESKEKGYVVFRFHRRSSLMYLHNFSFCVGRILRLFVLYKFVEGSCTVGLFLMHKFVIYTTPRIVSHTSDRN